MVIKPPSTITFLYNNDKLVEITLLENLDTYNLLQ